MEKTFINSKNSITNIFSFSDLIKYKDLFFELVAKDIKMRHKQTVFGVLWVIFQPLLSAVIFTFIFGTIFKIPSDKMAYPVFVFIGLNFWNLFSTSLVAASGSLAGNESLIKKVYFPRIIVPLASITTNLLDFLISTLFLLVISLYYANLPSPIVIFYYPLLLIFLLLFLVGLSLFLSALNVRYRDVRQILPFFIQILIFLTPVFYPLTIVSQDKQWILALNPLTTIIEMARNYFLGVTNFNLLNFTISLLVSLAAFIIGLIYFKKTEKYFADLV